MGLIKEPLDVDFVVNPRPLTKKEQLAISAFIKADKEKRVLTERKQQKSKLVFGSAKGMFVIKPGFDEPLEDFKDYM